MSVNVVMVKNKIDGSRKALDLLKKVVSKDTLLLLSGGSSPTHLYRLIADEKTLKPGGVVLIDERYGLLMHDKSNEKMIKDSGLLSYLNNEGIPFCGILEDLSLQETVKQFEIKLGQILNKFPKKVAIMGIGADSHTAGIKPDLEYDHFDLVTCFDDELGYFGKRVTITFEGLMKIDKFILLVFGDNKKQALQNIFKKEDQKHFPAVFYAKASAEVTIITDISV